MTVLASIFIPERSKATSTGWMMKGSPDLRTWLRWARYATQSACLTCLRASLPRYVSVGTRRSQYASMLA